VYEVVPLENAALVEEELRRQAATFEELLGSPPTHLDTHQHVHRHEPVRSVLARIGAELGRPVREVTEFARYSGAFYAEGAIDIDSLLSLLARLPPGVTELGCHPAAWVDFDSDYGRDRERELKTLCDPRVRWAIDELGIELRSFADLVGAAS